MLNDNETFYDLSFGVTSAGNRDVCHTDVTVCGVNPGFTCLDENENVFIPFGVCCVLETFFS